MEETVSYSSPSLVDFPKVLNFDHAANVPTLPEAVEEYKRVSILHGNPHSVHVLGTASKAIVSDAEREFQRCFPTYPFMRFTPGGGTIANKDAVLGALPRKPKFVDKKTRRDLVIMSAIEHASMTDEVMKWLNILGYSVAFLPVDQYGIVILDSLKKMLVGVPQRIALVSVMLVNNEIGSIQPLEQIIDLCGEHAPHAIIHTDAAQGLFELQHLEKTPDVVSICMYKIGGPHIGCVLAKKKKLLSTEYLGSLDVPSIAASAAALVHWDAHSVEHRNKCAVLRRTLSSQIKQVTKDLGIDALEMGPILESDRPKDTQATQPDTDSNNTEQKEQKGQNESDTIVSTSPESKNLDQKEKEQLLVHPLSVPHILNVLLPLRGDLIVKYLSEHGVCISSGSACSNPSAPNKIISAMGWKGKTSQGSLRFSFHHQHTIQDLKQLCDTLRQVLGRFKNITTKRLVRPDASKRKRKADKKEQKAERYVPVKPPRGEYEEIPFYGYKYMRLTSGELFLKGKNAKHFKAILQRSLNTSLGVEVVSTVSALRCNGCNGELIRTALATPGIAKISPTLLVRDREKVWGTVVGLFRIVSELLLRYRQKNPSLDPGDGKITFKAEVVCVNKFRSGRPSSWHAELGGVILENFPFAEVKLNHPDIIINCVFENSRALIWHTLDHISEPLRMAEKARLAGCPLALSSKVETPLPDYESKFNSEEAMKIGPEWYKTASLQELETLAPHPRLGLGGMPAGTSGKHFMLINLQSYKRSMVIADLCMQRGIKLSCIVQGCREEIVENKELMQDMGRLTSKLGNMRFFALSPFVPDDPIPQILALSTKMGKTRGIIYDHPDINYATRIAHALERSYCCSVMLPGLWLTEEEVEERYRLFQLVRPSSVKLIDYFWFSKEFTVEEDKKRIEGLNAAFDICRNFPKLPRPELTALLTKPDNGRVLCLLSGGIDSPVAAHLISRAGFPIDFVHFASHIDRVDNIVEIREKLTQARNAFRATRGESVDGKHDTLNVVSFSRVQEKIVEICGVKNEPYRTFLYKLYMLRIAAEVIGKDHHSLAVGDSWGQVASQTVPNIRVLRRHCPKFIQTPLLTYSKAMIIHIAETIGTFAPSTMSGTDDCCTMYLPKSPILNADRDTVAELVQQIDKQYGDLWRGVEVSRIQ